MRPDPRIRQNLDRISTSLESVADDARTGCFTFTKSYVEPCFSSILTCCTSCLPQAKTNHPHYRNRYSRRAEFPFGFYDYDDLGSDDEMGSRRGLLAWGTDELDRLLAGSGGSEPPRRREPMFYGAVGDGAGGGGLRRKSAVGGRDSPDPTVIPGSTMFGFLSKFGVRGKGMRYKPSAANLQEHPQRSGRFAHAESSYRSNSNGRKRSGTGSSSGSQGDSLRSRGDLWPSDDEDDAVVIGDDAFPRSSDGESAEVMETGVGTEDEEQGRNEVNLLVDDGQESKNGKEKRRRPLPQRGYSVDESRSRTIGSKESSSAPPSILATSPNPYQVTFSTSPLRPASVRLKEATSINQAAQRAPLPKLISTGEKSADMVRDMARPQMAQVPSPNSIRSFDSSPLLIDGDPPTATIRDRPPKPQEGDLE